MSGFNNINWQKPPGRPKGSQVIGVEWNDEGRFFIDVITPDGTPATAEVTARAARQVKEQLDSGKQLYLSWGGRDGGPGAWLNG